MGLQVLGIKQLSRHYGLLLVLVGVEGGDALLGGAVFFIGKPRFLQAVQSPVPGKQKGCPVADLQVFWGNSHTFGGYFLNFLPQVFRIQCHAVAKNVGDALTEDPGGQQMQGKFPVFVDDRMAGVAAALVANHDIIVPCQQIHHPPFSLVAPVDANDRAIFLHTYSPLGMLPHVFRDKKRQRRTGKAARRLCLAVSILHRND